MPRLWCVYKRDFETGRPQGPQEWSTGMNCLMLSDKGSSAARKFVRRMSLALALGASLSGCAVGPKYHRPTVNLQPFHNGLSIETRAASLPAPPLDQWWTRFRDPELTRIVMWAVAKNPDLLASITLVD